MFVKVGVNIGDMENPNGGEKFTMSPTLDSALPLILLCCAPELAALHSAALAPMHVTLSKLSLPPSSLGAICWLLPAACLPSSKQDVAKSVKSGNSTYVIMNVDIFTVEPTSTL